MPTIRNKSSRKRKNTTRKNLKFGKVKYVINYAKNDKNTYVISMYVDRKFVKKITVSKEKIIEKMAEFMVKMKKKPSCWLKLGGNGSAKKASDAHPASPAKTTGEGKESLYEIFVGSFAAGAGFSAGIIAMESAFAAFLSIFTGGDD